MVRFLLGIVAVWCSLFSILGQAPRSQQYIGSNIGAAYISYYNDVIYANGLE